MQKHVSRHMQQFLHKWWSHLEDLQQVLAHDVIFRGEGASEED